MQVELTSKLTPSSDWQRRFESLQKTSRGRIAGTRCNRTPFRLALLLALLATLTLEIADADSEQPAWIVILTFCSEVTVVFALGMLARWFDSSYYSSACRIPSSSTPQIQSVHETAKSPLIWILCLATVPFIIEVLVRAAMEIMLPLELLLLTYFRDGVLALAVFAHRNDCQRMCCSLSTFLVIFASAISTQLRLHGLVVTFAIVGILWLMRTYWESLSGRLAATSENMSSRRWLTLLPILTVLILVGLPVASTQTHALNGFMPSSGGTEWYSESARSGVGNGDALVAGADNIQSFAPIDDAPFLSSHEPSLYDLFDDSYDKPVEIQKQDRAIALSSDLAMNQKNDQIAESKQAGKEFSTLRKFGSAKRSEIADLDSNALFYVKGRVPLHLKLEVYDRYDGIVWSPESLAEVKSRLTMETLHGRPWLHVPNAQLLEIYGPPETHALKIVRLNTNRIPSPTQLLGLHIDQVDRADFFDWAQPGIVKMDRDKLPSMAVVHVQSRVVDERRIPNSAVHLSGGPTAYRKSGQDDQSKKFRLLAEEWTKGTSFGWTQVKTVVNRLRLECVRDHDARPPSNCDHTVAHFLFESRRGPDYDFASAAVLMLRSLGYSARLVSGFYVEPSRYDSRSHHTPVVSQDVHFWGEVSAGGGDWIPIEPTPGYELLQPPTLLTEYLWAALISGWQYFMVNILWISAAVMVSVWLLFVRLRIEDQIATAIWKWWPVRNERVFVQRTICLLDRRCHRMGFSRSRAITRTRWLDRFTTHFKESERLKAREFKRLAEWADFGPVGAAIPIPHARDLCQEAVWLWSFHRIKNATSSLPRSSEFRPTSLFGIFVYQPVILLRRFIA